MLQEIVLLFISCWPVVKFEMECKLGHWLVQILTSGWKPIVSRVDNNSSNNRKRARASSSQIRIYFKGNIGLVGWTDYK